MPIGTPNSGHPLVDFRIDGLKALDAALKELPQAIAKRELTGAMFAGGQVLRKEVLARAPDSPKVHKWGDLRANIKVRYLKLLYDGAVAVGVTTGRAFYAKWLEYGRGPVQTVRADVLTDLNKFYGTDVAAQPARPFMRPAMDAGAPRALTAIVARLKAGIERQAKRLAGKK